MANDKLSTAKQAKNDEFYTQYYDIENEVKEYYDYNHDVFRGKTVLLPCDDPEWSNFTKFFAQNFEKFGLKKLISTSFAAESKKIKDWHPTLFETESPYYDADKSRTNGKIFVLDEDLNKDGRFNINDLRWSYLEGDGDFRSDEVKALRDEADIIVTNPPFSIFREYFAWLMESGKQFLMIANKNCITYKEVFPYIKADKIWAGHRLWSGGMWFETKNPDDVDELMDGVNMKNIPAIWLTNMDHERHHEPLKLMTLERNLKHSKHKEIRGMEGYDHYDNYDAIEVPFTDAIPDDYNGIMGVPISFIEKYCPDQFEIIWQASGNTRASAPKDILARLKYKQHPEDRGGCTIVKGGRTYGRILIQKRR